MNIDLTFLVDGTGISYNGATGTASNIHKLCGPQGLTGPTGPDGPTGPSGGPRGPTGPTGNIINFGFFYNANPTSNIGTTPLEITWSTLGLTGGTAVTLSGGLITLNKTGVYEIQVDVAYENDTQSRENLRTFLSTDGVPTPLTNSDVYTYHRVSSAGNGSGHITYVSNFSTGTSIRVWVVSLIGGTTCDLILAGTRAYVRTLN